MLYVETKTKFYPIFQIRCRVFPRNNN